MLISLDTNLKHIWKEKYRIGYSSKTLGEKTVEVMYVLSTFIILFLLKLNLYHTVLSKATSQILPIFS